MRKPLPKGQQEQLQAKPSGWQRAAAKFGAYFEERGLGARDIPAAIVVHELLGACIALAAWTSCYAVQPSKTVAQPLVRALSAGPRGVQAQAAWNASLARAAATVQRLPWLNKAPGADPLRLTTSLAESLCLRAAAKPATFTFKLWASYQLILLTKRHQGGQAGQQQQPEKRPAKQAAGAQRPKKSA